MNTQLLRGVPQSEAKEVAPRINSWLADPVIEYVHRAIRLQRKKTKSVDFDSPSWAYKQAHEIGYNQALEDVLTLLNHKG